MRYFIFFVFLALYQLEGASHWDWEQIDTEEVDFPLEFLWGAGVSEYQVSGGDNCPNSQWAEWEALIDKDRSGSSADQWHLYEKDIALMEQLGLNAFRFSIEWSRIEPEEGVFDQEAIEHYRNLIRELTIQGISPMITLHHFTNPLWFERLEGFEKEENTAYFVRFAKRMFEEFGSDVTYWCTINEPSVYMFMGYIRGEFPPGKEDYNLAALVLKNLLQAHVETYKALKEMPYGKEAQIGFVHCHFKFEPKTSWNPLAAIPCRYLTKIFHEVVMQFFKTGEFEFYFPFKAELSFSMPEAVDSYDFFGLNYYSRAVIEMQMSLSELLIPSCHEGEIMTDMPYAIYPEGFYQAILDAAAFGKPVIVTENGIADALDDRRGLFIERYLYALSQAIKEGSDVRGYFYWSLIDNFEWAEGWAKKFGLYSLDLETKERILREGSLAYQKKVKRFKNSA